jgi:hypothetical protein
MDIEFAEYEVLFSETCKSIVRYDHLLIEINADERHKAKTVVRRLDELNFAEARSLTAKADRSDDCKNEST